MTTIINVDEALTKGYDPVLVRRLGKFIKPYRFQFFTGLVLMLINSAAAVAGPYFVKLALDSGIAARSIPGLRTAVLGYLVVSLTQWVAMYIRVNLMARAGQGIIYDLRTRLFEHLQELSLGFYTHFSVGRVITRVINDVGVLREFITWAILATARDLFALGGIIVAMVAMDLRLSLYTFTIMPVMIALTIIFQRTARTNYRLVRTAISWVNSVLAENINGVRVVQAFTRQNRNYQIFSEQVNQNHKEKQINAARIASAFPAVIEFIGRSATALVIWLGGTAVLGDQITPGILVAFILYVDRFFDPIRDLSRRYNTFQSTMAGSERIFSLLDAPIEVKDDPDAIELPRIEGQVEFDKVSFNYPEDPECVLIDINLVIEPGETVALVGETGAGKSTLVKLLSRFHDPVQGRILIDGYDLRKLTQKSLRRQMGIVLQDPFLFSGTVRDNISFSRPEAPDHEIQSAAKAVNAHDFIINLRRGYDTPVEEGGVVLSVGQRQLISFARALLANPRILILDEATSSVDVQTESLIQKALSRLLAGRTAFVIAHRLSTVINADRIVVIQDGRIVEQGTHAELLQMQGRYFDLYRTGFENRPE